MRRFGTRTRFVRLLVACSLLGLLLPLAAPLTVGAANAPAAGQTIDGTFTTIDGDPEPGKGGAARELYFVTDAKGVTTQLILSEQVAKAAGGVLALDRQKVSVVVDSAPAPSAQGGGAPALTVNAISVSGGPKKALGPTFGAKAFINIMCKFSDDASQPVTPSYIQNSLFSGTAPGLNAYWQENSYGNINLNGTQTVGWFTLPSPRSTYITGAPPGTANLTLLAQDCTNTALGSVTFINYVGFNLIFNGLLDCCAWGGGVFLNIQGHNQVWAATWMPPWGYSPDTNPTYDGQTVLAHETGHAFGLKHSGDKVGTTYAEGWNPMSGAYWHCDLFNDPTVGCKGRDGIANDKDFLGWIPAANKRTITGANQTLTLTNLAGGAVGTNPLEIIIPDATNPGTQWTTVEMRNRFGNDFKNPVSAVIIHSVDMTRTNPAWAIASNPACTTGTGGTCGFDDAEWLGGSQYAVPNSGGVVVHINSVGTNSANVTVGTGGGAPPTPSAPTLNMGLTGNTWVTINWTESDPSAYITVYSWDPIGGAATPIALAAGTTQYTKYPVTNAYYACFQLVAWNGSGNSGLTTWNCFYTRPYAPYMPHPTASNTSAISYGWANFETQSYIAVYNGGTTALGQNATTYTKTGVLTGYYDCELVGAYNANFTTWETTPAATGGYVCGWTHPATPNPISKTGSTATSVTFTLTNQDPYSLIMARSGINGGSLSAWTYYGQNATTVTVSGVPTGGYACIQVYAFNSLDGSYSAASLQYSGISGWSCGTAP